MSDGNRQERPLEKLQMEKGDPGGRLFLLCDSKNSDYARLYPESLSEAGFKSH